LLGHAPFGLNETSLLKHVEAMIDLFLQYLPEFVFGSPAVEK
jgi:hypothetical protein